MKIALVGNPNCGKTTLFNAYTGSSQYVGNWPGVTVEKKSGRYKKDKDIEIIDLPGIYSLSPYTSEEVITRDFLLNEKPDVVINIIDAANLERNLYLTTQILDMNVPTIAALNRIDLVDNENVTLDVDQLSKRLGLRVIPIIATKNKDIDLLINEAINTTETKDLSRSFYTKDLSLLLSHIENEIKHIYPENSFYHAIKIFEKDQDSKIKYKYSSYIDRSMWDKIDQYHQKEDEDGEAIIINEKYDAVARILDGIYIKKDIRKKTRSDKIDSILTNKWLGLPIFLLILYAIYYISIQTVGDWSIGYVENFFSFLNLQVDHALNTLNASSFVKGLLMDGVINSMMAIFIFVPQLMILFIFLSILEDSGYMSRVAFILDRIFRKFGLSGKSFIPMLIGTGCSIPGVMATRTIENEKERNMTIILTPFVPCGAKLPVFVLFITMLFPTSAWVGPAIYIIAFSVIILSGILMKKTKTFMGSPSPFVMELPPYTLPSIKGVWIHMWERAKGFVKKAGSIIFLANIILWFLMNFDLSLNFLDGNIDHSILASFGNAIKFIYKPLGFGDNWAPAVASITGLIAKETVVTTFAQVGSIVPVEFSQVSAFAFIIFIIFAAPCFAAIGAMKRELNNTKLTLFAVIFQTLLAYILAFITNTVGNLIFKGTSAVEKIRLDYTAISEIEESGADQIVSNGLLGYIVLGIFIIAIVSILYSEFIKKED